MAAILVLEYKSIQQVKYWQNSYQLMGHVLNYNPQSPLANLNYGIALMKRGDYQGAIAYTTKATQLSPDNSNTYYNLGLSYIFAQNLEKAQEQYRILLKRAPELAHKLQEAMEEIPRQLGRSP